MTDVPPDPASIPPPPEPGQFDAAFAHAEAQMQSAPVAEASSAMQLLDSLVPFGDGLIAYRNRLQELGFARPNAEEMCTVVNAHLMDLVFAAAKKSTLARMDAPAPPPEQDETAVVSAEGVSAEGRVRAAERAEQDALAEREKARRAVGCMAVVVGVLLVVVLVLGFVLVVR